MTIATIKVDLAVFLSREVPGHTDRGGIKPAELVAAHFCIEMARRIRGLYAKRGRLK